MKQRLKIPVHVYAFCRKEKSKFWDTLDNYCFFFLFLFFFFYFLFIYLFFFFKKKVNLFYYNGVMRSKDAIEMTNSTDPDQTAPLGEV